MFYYDYLMLSSNAESALPVSMFFLYMLDVTQVRAMMGWYNDYLNIIFITNRVQKDVSFANIFVQIKVCCFSYCVFNL